MQRIFTLFVFFLVSLSLTGQELTIDPVSMTVSGTPSDKIQADYFVTNTGETDVDVYWRVIRTDIPEEWEFSMCDYHTCYLFGLEECPSDKANPFNVDYEQIYMLKADPKGVPYVGEVLVEYFSVDDPEEVYNSIVITFDATLSSTNDAEIEEMALFPNPTNDFFQISNDRLVSKVSIFDVVGKEVQSFEHEVGNAYSIATYQKGIYLVRLFDNEGNNIKVIRLSKR